MLACLRALTLAEKCIDSFLTTPLLALLQILADVARLASPGVAYVTPTGDANTPSSMTQALVLSQRTFVNNYRNIGLYGLRLAMFVMLCVSVGLREVLFKRYICDGLRLCNTDDANLAYHYTDRISSRSPAEIIT